VAAAVDGTSTGKGDSYMSSGGSAGGNGSNSDAINCTFHASKCTCHELATAMLATGTQLDIVEISSDDPFC
jgi:hypothetical protein